MPLACVGISHERTPHGVRDSFATSLADITAAYRALWPLFAGSQVAELAILATCNRVELYAAAASPAQPISRVPRQLLAALGTLGGMPADALGTHVYTHAGADALRHLCRVAAGMESMILGEAEILGQVGAAFDLGAATGATGPVLEAAFRTAVRAGRRARTETGIGKNPLSVATAAVRVAAERADLATARTLVLGSGSMGRHALAALATAGAKHLAVVSRTLTHAQDAASGVGAKPRAWHELSAALAEADVVLCATGAPHPVVPAVLVREAVKAFPGNRAMLFLDIAMPRDVEPAVREVPGVTLVDMDDMHKVVAANLEARRSELPAVEDIVDEEIERFEEWRRGAALRPVLSALRSHGDVIRRRELERLFRRIGDLDPTLKDELARFSESLTSKLLHEPTQRLRAEADPERRADYVELTRQLFGLDACAHATGDLHGTGVLEPDAGEPPARSMEVA